MARILIVDDSGAVLRRSRELLEAAGHDVITAPNWRECCGSLAVQPDLALIDDLLPGLEEGDHLVAELRRHPMTKQSRIVLFSGRSERELQQVVGETGAHGYIWKGVSEADFVARVSAQLSAARW